MADMKVSRRSWTFLSRTELIIFTASVRRVEQEDGSNIFNINWKKGIKWKMKTYKSRRNDENIRLTRVRLLGLGLGVVYAYELTTVN